MDRSRLTQFVPLLALLAATFVIKIVVFLALREHPLLQPDSGLDTTAYVDLARRVVDGDWSLGPGLYFVSPFYIYFVAIIVGMTSSFTALRIVQMVLGTACVGCVFSMTRTWFGRPAAWLAAALAALTGLLTFYEALILQSSIDAAVAAIGLALLTAALRRSDSRWFVLPGLVFGLQTLNRPNILFAAAGLVVLLFAVGRRRMAALMLAAGLVAGVVPAAIRNAVVAHQFALVSSHGGLNFFIGNNAQASGFYQFVSGVAPTIGGQEADTRRVAERALGRPLSDEEVSRYFSDQAWSWITAHPGDAAVLFARKLGYAFHAQHIPLPHSYPFYVAEFPVFRLLPIGLWILTPLGLVGLVLAAPRDRLREYIVWAAFVPLYAAAVAAFFIAERYRLPLIPPLCAGAGAALAVIWRLLQARRWPALGAAMAAVALLAFLANMRIEASDGRWIEGLRLAQTLAMRGKYDEADEWARRLDADSPPRPGAGSGGLGLQLLDINQPARALPLLQHAHGAEPGDAAIAFALGRALLRTGRSADALPPLRQGFESGIALPDGGLDYALALAATGDTAGATAAGARIQPGDQADVESWLRMGRASMEARAPAVAERFFRQAATMRPELAPARQQYGLCLLVAGRMADAARELEAAVRLDPRNADSLSHLAYAELALGRADEARTHVQAALTLNPDDPVARQLAGLLDRR